MKLCLEMISEKITSSTELMNHDWVVGPVQDPMRGPLVGVPLGPDGLERPTESQVTGSRSLPVG
jgi:hypothetical protein